MGDKGKGNELDLITSHSILCHLLIWTQAEVELDTPKWSLETNGVFAGQSSILEKTLANKVLNSESNVSKMVFGDTDCYMYSVAFLYS